MAQILFYAGETTQIHNLNGSGLGFYGSSFGSSVTVGQYQSTTWITDSNGTIQGPQVDNITYTHPNSGSINGAASVNLLDIPNQLATLEIRFTHNSAVRTQNNTLYIYDRVDKNNDPSGVTCQVAEIIHPALEQTGQTGSGDSSWIDAHGSGVTVPLADAPGVSGLSPNGASTSSVEHSHYVAISASPDSIGSKLFGGYFECEYL